MLLTSKYSKTGNKYFILLFLLKKKNTTGHKNNVINETNEKKRS